MELIVFGLISLLVIILGISGSILEFFFSLPSILLLLQLQPFSGTHRPILLLFLVLLGLHNLRRVLYEYGLVLRHSGASTVHKVLHLLSYQRHLEDLNNVWPFLGVLV